MSSRLVVTGVCAVSLLGGHLGGVAGASEPPPGTVTEEERSVREEPAWTPTGSLGERGKALWFWPEGKRTYQLTGLGETTTSDLVAYDDAGEPVVVAPLTPRAWGNGMGARFYSETGLHHVAAVDREQGRVFVAYRNRPQDITASNPGAAQEPCANSATGCLGGIHILDGSTLASLGRARLELPTAESPRVVVIPRAMTYAPPVAESGWAGRVLMVVEEIATQPAESNSATYPFFTNNAAPRRNGANVAYAVAFDPDSGRQEWAVRLEGCRNSREPRAWLRDSEGHPAAVFRTGGASPSLFVACHGNAGQQGVVVRVPLDADGVPASLPVTVGDPVASVDPDAERAGVDSVAGVAPRQEVFPGPDKVTVVLADPASQRILMRVDDAGEVWWVFDGVSRQFLGTIGIGGYNHGHTTYGLDPDIGRLYVAAAPSDRAPGGLYVADIRANPLAQATHYSHLAAFAGGATGQSNLNSEVGRAMSVRPRAGAAATAFFVHIERDEGSSFRVFVDSTAPGQVAAAAPEVVRTFDLDEQAGVTDATFDGTARGFGFRAILLGGVEGASRVGPADPVGVARGAQQVGVCSGTSTGCVGPVVRAVTPLLPGPDPCTDAQREVVAAFVGPRGPAVVDGSSARGEAQPILADVRTREDVAAPVTRCGPEDWEGLWQAALVSRAPVGEPGVAWPFEDATSTCTATEEESGDSWADPVVGAFSSRVACGQDEVSGWGQARGIGVDGVDGVSVADTLSSFRIYRDEQRGMVARVESIARGVNVGGVVRIDTIRGAAESWANGRKAPEPEGGEAGGAEASGSNPFNCDRSRPAGTCFQRHIFGVSVADPRGGVAYRCGPCGDEGALIDGLNRGLGANGYARFRVPDPALARGSDDGYIAAITKTDKERFSDIVLNADLLETMVPMLEIVRSAPHNRPSTAGARGSGNLDYVDTGTPPRGRQVYQFAAVEVSSSYGIQCLLVYDEATNTCAGEKLEPGAITVSLSDSDGRPLAGGGFEVRADVDADGVLGLKDTLLPEGACVTAEDGIGTCSLDNLQPGTYLVSQVAAPPGYAKSAEPFVVELASGEQRTVAFTNVSNVSTIDLKATDENGQPLSGATFAAYPDADSDGKVAPDAKPAAECTTDSAGVCQMKVPAGSYVLVQTAAPGGLEGIEPVPFTFASGGQVAAVTVVNYPPGAPAQPEAPASPVYTPPVDYAPPTEFVDDTYVAPTVDVPVVDEAPVSVPDRIGGTVTQVIRAPGDALRLLARDPKQAVAWTAALALFVLAAMAVRRRQQALALLQG